MNSYSHRCVSQEFVKSLAEVFFSWKRFNTTLFITHSTWKLKTQQVKGRNLHCDDDPLASKVILKVTELTAEGVGGVDGGFW